MSFVRGMEHGEQTLPTNDLCLSPSADPARPGCSHGAAGLHARRGERGLRTDKKKELKTTLCSWWECTQKKLPTTDTPECQILPGLKELTLVVPLTRLWDKPSRFLPFYS